MHLILQLPLLGVIRIPEDQVTLVSALEEL